MILTDSFFFSSRRRHTRLQGDWSSDVCSSDLESVDDDHRVLSAEAIVDRLRRGGVGRPLAVDHELVGVASGLELRSEERRVGKECRSWAESEKMIKKEVDSIDYRM